MKKLLIVLLCLVLAICGALAESGSAPNAGSPAVEYSAAPGEKLGFALLKQLYASGENRVISPGSLVYALGMAAEGAQGETLAEILAALGAESMDELTAVPPVGVHSANAAFTAPELSLREEYAAELAEKYGAEFFEMDAQVVEKVNAWVREHTGGLIDSLLNQPPNAQTGLMLLNAVAMEADWAKPFMEGNTSEEDFHSPKGDVPVQMMHQTDMFDYAEKDGLQIIRLPYANSDLEMWIALPAEDGAEGLNMEALLDVLANEGMFYLQSDAESTHVELSLPKLDISDENSLSEALQLLGVERAFGAEADFSGIADEALFIDEILQKARVQVDESGTKAVAATLVVMPMMAAPGSQLEPVEMRLDRPFVYAIADGATGTLCFAGVVENPAG